MGSMAITEVAMRFFYPDLDPWPSTASAHRGWQRILQCQWGWVPVVRDVPGRTGTPGTEGQRTMTL